MGLVLYRYEDPASPKPYHPSYHTETVCTHVVDISLTNRARTFLVVVEEWRFAVLSPPAEGLQSSQGLLAVSREEKPG